MDYTLAGIRERILVDKLDDEDFEPGVIDNFINDAQLDIFSEFPLPFTEKIFTGTLPSGSYMFQFPDDVSQLLSVVITDSQGRSRDIIDKRLDFKDFNKLFPNPEVGQAGYIYSWTLFAGNMMVSRPTDEEYYMRIYYNRVPRLLLADTDVPEVPVEFQEALLLGAFYRVQQREGDLEESLLTQSEYRRKMEQLADRQGQRIGGTFKMRSKQRGQ